MTTITTIAGRQALALANLAGTRWRAWRDRARTARVCEIYCPACTRWRHPRRFTRTAAICRDCTNP